MPDSLSSMFIYHIWLILDASSCPTLTSLKWGCVQQPGKVGIEVWLWLYMTKLSRDSHGTSARPTFPSTNHSQTVMVHFVCQFDWNEGCQILSSTLFLCGSVRVSPVEIQVRANRLSRDYPLQCGWASSNELRMWIERKGRGRLDLLPPWAMKSILSCLGTWVLLVLGLLDSGWDLDRPQTFLSLQTWTRFLILHIANGISQPP